MGELRALATDAVVVHDSEIVLMKRAHEPYAGTWVLPGGLVEPGKTAREACIRETTEEIGLDVTVTDFLGLYDEPDRDPRDNVSAVYRCVPSDETTDTSRGRGSRIHQSIPAIRTPTIGIRPRNHHH